MDEWTDGARGKVRVMERYRTVEGEGTEGEKSGFKLQMLKGNDFWLIANSELSRCE